MIDTININTTDFEIDIRKNELSKYPLAIKTGCNLSPTEKNIELPFLMKDKNGIEIFGTGLTLARSFENPKGLINGTGILKIGTFTNCKTGKTDRHFSFQCSMPKFLTGENFNLANKSDVLIFKDYIQDIFRDMGIYTNVEKMQISRLDLTKNIETEYRFENYLSVLKMCNLTKSFQSEINSNTYNTGTGKGKTKMICCYDKLQELENNQCEIPVCVADKNIFRCEYRQLDKKPIQKIGISNLQELSQNYDELKNDYKKNVKKILLDNFKKTSFEDKRFYDIESIAISCINQQKRNWISEFIFQVGIQASKESYTQIFDNLDSILNLESEMLIQQGKTEDYARVNKARHKKVFQERLNQIFSQLNNSFGIPYTQLFEELQNKLVA